MRANVLIVDDVEAIRSFFSMVLTKVGLEQVFTASNGEEVMDKITKNDVDLVFLDINLPGRNGLSLLNWIKSSHPDIKVVMCSGDTGSQLMKSALDSGADDYLAKPVSIDNILSTLRKFGLPFSIG